MTGKKKQIVSLEYALNQGGLGATETLTDEDWVKFEFLCGAADNLNIHDQDIDTPDAYRTATGFCPSCGYPTYGKVRFGRFHCDDCCWDHAITEIGHFRYL